MFFFLMTSFYETLAQRSRPPVSVFVFKQLITGFFFNLFCFQSLKD